MAAWHYNWAAAHAVQGDQVYFSCQNSVSEAVYPVPKVLALSPAVSLTLNNVTSLKGMQVSLGRGKDMNMTSQHTAIICIDCIVIVAVLNLISLIV